MKVKWVFPFFLMFLLGIEAAIPATRSVDIETKVFHVIGELLLTVILLMIVQPWKVDQNTDHKT